MWSEIPHSKLLRWHDDCFLSAGGRLLLGLRSGCRLRFCSRLGGIVLWLDNIAHLGQILHRNGLLLLYRCCTSSYRVLLHRCRLAGGGVKGSRFMLEVFSLYVAVATSSSSSSFLSVTAVMMINCSSSDSCALRIPCTSSFSL